MFSLINQQFYEYYEDKTESTAGNELKYSSGITDHG